MNPVAPSIAATLLCGASLALIAFGRPGAAVAALAVAVLLLIYALSTLSRRSRP